MTNLQIVDDLGKILAKIAELEVHAESIKEVLRRDFGPGEYEGRLFRATVGEDGTSTKYDNKAIREKLIELGHRRFVNAHKEEEPKKGAVRVVSRTGKDAAQSAAKLKRDVAADMAARGHAAADRRTAKKTKGRKKS